MAKMNIIRDMKRTLAEAIEEIEAEHGVNDRYRLKGHFEWHERLSTESFTPGTRPGHMLELSWGNKELPNGINRVPFLLPHKKVYLKRIIEEVRLTANQRTSIVGRDQELREANIEHNQMVRPPDWAKAVTMIAYRLAHKRFETGEESCLGLSFCEGGPVLSIDTPWEIQRDISYHYDAWSLMEWLDIETRLPVIAQISSRLKGKPLSSIIEFTGDLKNITDGIKIEKAGIHKEEDMFGDYDRTPWVSFKTNKLVRLDEPPEGIEIDPMKAWLAAAQRSK